MIGNDALWTQLQSALADLAASQEEYKQLKAERDVLDEDLTRSNGNDAIRIENLEAECTRLRNVLLDIRDGGQMRTGYTYAALARAALAAQPNGTTTHCEWKHGEDDSDAWETACGEMFCLNTGTPKENKVCFCPYCGKPLSEAARPNDAKQADRDSAKSA